MGPARSAITDQPPGRERPRRAFRHSRRALHMLWEATPAGSVALVVLVVAAGLLQPVSAVVGKLIVDAVVAAQRSDAGGTAVRRALGFVALELGVFMAMAAMERGLG